MTWILPKSLHTLASVQGTAALISDSEEQSKVCAQSLLVRSKPLPLRTWSRKWKRDSWTRHLCGRILDPSRGKAFETEWISSVAGTPASRSVPSASASAETTPVTSGLGSQMELSSCDPSFASSRTSRVTSPSDYATSSQSWTESVTLRRGAYSARLKWARPTSESASSSWPTATTRDWKDTTGCSPDGKNPDGSHRNRKDRLVGVIAAEMASGPVVRVNLSTNGSRPVSLALNPRWVETLMGLPVGWVMPSCASPATIVPMSSASSATESSQLRAA
jgi:hypothetical protein